MKIRTVFLAVFLLALNIAARATAAGPFEEGRHYTELPAPKTFFKAGDERLEIVMFFWYGCGACALLDPVFTEWAETAPENVRVVKLPTTYVEPWNMHARIFMTLEEMGRERDLHEKIFEAFKNPAGMARAESDLESFAERMGLEPEEFMRVYRSAAVDGRMESLEEIVETYNPPVVPALVVDGRYLTDLGQVDGPAELLELAEFLLKKAGAAGK